MNIRLNPKYKLPFHKELFISIAFLFLFFILAIFFFQYNREKEYKKEILNSILQDYNNLVHRELLIAPMTENRLISIADNITDKDLRVTIISALDGHVITDSKHDDSIALPSHKTRPEISQALTDGIGYSLRSSETMDHTYFYAARRYGDIIIRSSLPFDISTTALLKIDNGFIYFLLGTSLLAILILFYFCSRLGKSISTLQDFSTQAEQNQSINLRIKTPHNDIGKITHNIIRIYQDLLQTKEALSIEKEKLIKHLQFSKEGLAIFSHDKKLILANNLFIQYINLISDNSFSSTDSIFDVLEFEKITTFINRNLHAEREKEEYKTHSIFITKNGKSFQVECIIFQDSTFEIAINNVTQKEEESRLKRQLTQNIAHELKTPVSSIQGYMETILSNPDLPAEKRAVFLDRCYAQTGRLVGLLRDISLLNRMDESDKLFDSSPVHLNAIIHEIANESTKELENKNMSVDLFLPEQILISGNYSLTYSIFRNLLDNSIAYAGEDSKITINCYLEDDSYYYFSFADNGVGVSEEHLNRLFERFYRVDKGRSRKLGGTGLGLAIVKNAILFHRGEILAKNRHEGGLEFLFTLKK